MEAACFRSDGFVESKFLIHIMCHAVGLAARGTSAGTVRILPARRSRTVFAALANVGYCHQYPAIDYTHPANKPSKKGKVNMGDKSPKSVGEIIGADAEKVHVLFQRRD